MKPCHFVFLSIDFRKGERVERREGERGTGGEHEQCVPIAGVRTTLLSFKCFVAGREFERRMGDEH